ncbi:MAG: hypothetical protein JWO08_2988 [Verrucomicrobiaceae bacterium]|nr:hypothetical protein [Verrucomicrobiaceae bacterium]
MKNSAVIIILTSLASVLVTVAFFQVNSEPPSAVVTKLEAEVKAARDDASRLKKERDQLLAEVKKVTSEPSKGTRLANNEPTPLALPSGPTKAENAATGVAVRQKLNDPEVRDTLRKQQDVKIDMTYGSLFQKLSLNGEELDNFKGLLGDQLSNQTELSMKMVDPSLSGIERKSIQDQIASSKQRSEADIRKFLNNEDDYQTYQKWSNTQPERMMLQLGGSAFDSAGAPLSDEQREQLVDTMADVRNNPPTAPDGDPRTITAQSLTPEGIVRQLEQHRQDNARVRDDAAKFLSPQQIEALKKMQDQMLVMMEAGMKTTGQMFSGKK